MAVIVQNTFNRLQTTPWNDFGAFSRCLCIRLFRQFGSNGRVETTLAFAGDSVLQNSFQCLAKVVVGVSAKNYF